MMKIFRISQEKNQKIRLPQDSKSEGGKKMNKTIEEIVDSMQPTKAGGRPRRTRRLLRMIGAGGSSIGLVKGLIIFGAVAALISTMIGTYLISQTDDIALEGRLSYDLWVDGIPVGADDFVMDPDSFSDDKLAWGETEVFTHTFYSPPLNGNFSLAINLTWQTWLYPVSQPGHVFYGYEFTCLDEDDNEITEFTVLSGQPAREIQFVHTLDTHFAATTELLPFNLSFEVSEYNAPPIATDDTTTFNGLGYKDVDVMANDNDPDDAPAPLSITNVVLTSGNSHLSASIVAGMVRVTSDGAWTGVTVFTYTISDGDKTDTATLTVTYTG